MVGNIEGIKKKKSNAMTENQINILNRLAERMGFTKDYPRMFREKTSEEIMEFINDQKLSLSWKENALYSAKRYYELRHDENNKKEFFKEAQSITEKRKDMYLENEMSKKQEENWLSQDQLATIRDEYENYETEEQMYQYLILSMITLQPPLRPEAWVRMYIATKQDDVIKDEDKNFMYINDKNTQAFYYINKDKVSNAFSFNKEKNKKLQITPEFKEAVLKTLKSHPRTKLFDWNIKKQEDKLLSLLQKTTKNKFTFSMARASYRTYHVGNMTKSKDRYDLARLMRHSNEMAENVYRKVDGIDPKHMTDEQALLRIKTLEQTMIEKDKLIQELQEKLQVLITKKNDEISDAEKKKRRYDLIYAANKKGTAIKEANLLYYDIVKGEDGKYH